MLFSLSFFACDDDDDEADLDTTDPTITITSPATGATFMPGDVVELRADIMDNMGLEEVRVNVTDPSGTTREVDDNTINDFLNDNREKDLELDITLDENAPVGDYIIVVEAIDEAENSASQSVTVSVAE
ncbi:DUF4625 domain-containing protein [Pontibacter russatus]|uniref:DUF4625 domain-containing protein n=1 Tax=Pontibacter russatus TaxID=2694929 RepID=UPI00137AAF34|nr:DUF4625 domain-containing protein [Pontibacter russatus]